MNEYRSAILESITKRRKELDAESPDFYKLLAALKWFSEEESRKIDEYHNIGRLVFNNLGLLLQDLTVTTLLTTLGGKNRVKIKNKQGGAPRDFVIDWLNGKKAYQIKWRYATTDGTTVNKEIAFANQLGQSGYTPIFLTYYRSLRPEPLQCFNKIASAFGNYGQVYYEKDAWNHVLKITGFDLEKFIFSGQWVTQ